MYLKGLLIILLCSFGFLSNAQLAAGLLTGTITEKEGNISLPGAVVSLSGTNRYAVSNQNGNFEFLSVPEGTYTVKVTYIGYTEQTKEVVIETGKNSIVNFVLEPKSSSLSEVVVIGDRLRGQARALNQQKNNQNITNIISSDQVGRFPDANIGDALKRVPGITMQNDQGEARNIIIRGLAPNLNSVTINGDRIPSAEGDNRNVQMDLIPSDMISTIEVSKTLTSDMDADAIGGSVNLVTRSAPNGERVSFTAAGGYSPIRNGGNYTAGFVYGNRYFNNKLGAVLSTSYNNNNFGSDNVEAVWVKWDEDGNKLDYIEELDIRKYDVQRIRRSASLALDYKINSKNTLFAKAMYNWRDDRENRYRTRFRGIEPVFEGSTLVGFAGDIRMQTKGGIDNNRNKNTRLEDQRVQNYSLSGEHLLGTKVDFDWSVSHSTAKEFRPNERYMEFHNRGLGLSYSNDSEKPLYSVTEGSNTPANYTLRNITDNRDLTFENETGIKANFRFPFSVIADQKGRLRVGVRARLKEKERENIFYSYKETAGTIKNIGGIPNVFWGGDNWQAGSQYVPGTFATAEFLGNLDLSNKALFTQTPVPAEYLALNYNAKENIYAGYLRWDQDLNDKLSMIAGVRLESTGIDYTGNHILDEEDLEGTVSNKNDYVNVLPSLAFKYNVQDDFILRAAFTTALARPNYYALAPYVSVISEDEEIRAGNPHLKATYSYNFDLMLEKYFKSVGLVSGGAFYKNLQNFIYTYRTNNNYSSANFAADFPGISNPIPAGVSNWSFVQDRNGNNVDVYGFELAAQRQLDFILGAFFKNLGVYVNYTFTKSVAQGITNADGDEREGLGLPGTAPHMFNASLAWENKKFSARLSLNYTSGYLDELGSESFEDRYYDKQLFLDANASYKFTKKLRVFGEANNLTNQPLRYYQGVSSRTMQGVLHTTI